jgi:hypothetical protein
MIRSLVIVHHPSHHRQSLQLGHSSTSSGYPLSFQHVERAKVELEGTFRAWAVTVVYLSFHSPQSVMLVHLIVIAVTKEGRLRIRNLRNRHSLCWGAASTLTLWLWLFLSPVLARGVLGRAQCCPPRPLLLPYPIGVRNCAHLRAPSRGLRILEPPSLRHGRHLVGVCPCLFCQPSASLHYLEKC